ncbi:hypothetical protein EMIHUDRAFT_246879 [Emiliania huxleyi CCMP1516]|uniref:Uncharacterized protein n=2 Tax=Emiliania huxleyi TaxID=2903 RepID=A0A0D3IQ54_EMIH1|nr:hypothetical protein EMIHUDRAFT_246879 [Emiliania huxleyi CCMP1516]EOD13389.1 hypothetical protein EMIHUDRAFT_246879 [Emiliania huxleyi CCMP1516]|eukprot:XP_005765818.1 hypothetical protein EMIHUDRAFT_246879 [Emiliania huxleyi CCMP1516]
MNGYLVFKDAAASPKLQRFRFTGRVSSDLEVAQAGLLAGIAVEARQQSAQSRALRREDLATALSVLNLNATGLDAALLTSAPQGAVFWAVKDVVRREMLARLGITAGSGTLFLQYFTPQYTSPPPLPAWAVALGLDWRAIATLVAVAAGEVAYWLVRAPTEVQKTRAQLSALVVRTRLLLQRSGSSATQYAGITDALATIYREEGAAALFRGLPVRLAWNGLWVGAILGVQRAYYADAQTFFLTVVGEAAEALARPLRSSVF